tara:strand:- start:98 stop:217 length:120 start_codon:yes stop_codon:yes gene_type:complete
MNIKKMIKKGYMPDPASVVPAPVDKKKPAEKKKPTKKEE